MNERIRELAVETGWSEDIRYAPRAKEIEKFAELIVRECALQCVHNEDMDLIEKHFGVKE